MIYRDKKISFPAKTRISFSKLIRRLEDQSIQKIENPEIDTLLASCKQNKAFVEGFEEAEFNANDELIKKLCSTLFPDALQHNEIKGVIPPFEFRPFYVSTRFEKILKDSGTSFSFELSNFDEDQMYIFGCNTILQFYYQYPFLMTLPNLVTIPHDNGKTQKIYRLVMNGDLLEIEPAGKVATFTETDWLELLNDFSNINLWKQKFPPGSWIMKGIGLVTLFDVSSDQAISRLTSRLLSSPLQDLNDIVAELGDVIGVEDLTMGFLDHNQHAFETGLSGLTSVILKEKTSLPFQENLCAPSYQKLIIENKAIIITDVNKWNATSSCSKVSLLVEEAMAGSYLLIPVMYQEELLGYLELASPRPYALNGSSLIKINLVLPTLSMAIKRNRNEFQNRVEALIQQKCTTIHPSVKWRFEQESITYMKLYQDGDELREFNDIQFPDVYPLFGQLDISSSSRKRNEAVQVDLIKQLSQVQDILDKLWKLNITPIQEEMLYRLDKFKTDIQDGLFAGSEQNIHNFLLHEVHPILMKELKNKGDTHIVIDSYLNSLHPESQSLYEKRKEFDNQISLINRTLANRLDKKQVKAQEMFPHYYERYKTDGVEFTMYIGQAIFPSKAFGTTDLHNLQLWQLMSICELEREYDRLKTRLSLELDIASLVLVYSTPITIQFRMDEKIFDVDGAYNVRYEIIKKRIDKAKIKGTTERLTCPGKIAIIYSNAQDAVHYSRFIDFLQSKGLLVAADTEYLEVEDLPGISGLKALRVSIQFSELS